MKKMLKWYKLLKANDLLKFEEPEAEAPAVEEVTATEGAVDAITEEVKESEAPVVTEEKPAKKTRAKKAAEVGGTEEKPAKKSARSKSTPE
jgi:hypothetical protein